MSERVQSPFILTGSGRTGSTVIFEILANHGNFGWLSQYNYIFSSVPQLGLVRRLIKGVGQKEQGQNLSFFNQFFPRPLEVYPVWEYLCGKKFRQNSLQEVNPSRSEKNKTLTYFNQLLASQKKPNLLIKLTGPPRIEFLSGIFPDASYISIIRHPVAVVGSLVNVDFWLNKGIDKPHWKDLFTKEDFSIWEKYDKSKVALAALEWKAIYELTDEEAKGNQIDLKRVKYENFVNNPQQEIENSIKFYNSDFNLTDEIKSFVNSKRLKNMNYKALNRLSVPQIKLIQDICADFMREFDYEDFLEKDFKRGE